jgi:hypothetical protein
MGYILGDKPTNCIFCEKIRAQEDVQNLILWRGHTAFVMLNRYPYNNGHLMVVPPAQAASRTNLEKNHVPGTCPTGRAWRTHHALRAGAASGYAS